MSEHQRTSDVHVVTGVLTPETVDPIICMDTWAVTLQVGGVDFYGWSKATGGGRAVAGRLPDDGSDPVLAFGALELERFVRASELGQIVAPLVGSVGQEGHVTMTALDMQGLQRSSIVYSGTVIAVLPPQYDGDKHDVTHVWVRFLPTSSRAA